MSKIKKVLAITNNFPTSCFPEKGVFVMNILIEMHRQGVEVDVIAPVSIGSELKRLGIKKSVIDFNGLKVCQPYYLTIPQRFPRFRKFITKINDLLFGLAVWYASRNKSYDLVYTHFLQSVIPVLKYLNTRGAPVLLNLGESDPWDYDLYYNKTSWHSYLRMVNHIATVSKVNYDYVLSLDTELKGKTKYIHNGVNTNFFRPMEKAECRKQLSLDLNAKYVIFCGHLDERKGPLRVLEAIRGTDIKGIFLGSNGTNIPIGEEVAFLGSVLNTQVPLYLNAADVFAFPSRSEGMSNAVLEAVACCIPLVVSNRRFNTDFLCSEDGVIFIEPDDINEIRNAIIKALEVNENIAMRKALEKKRSSISLEARIKSILDFVNGNERLT